MPRKRKPRTRLQSRYRQQMRKCRLFRWTSQSEGEEDFKIFGPYSGTKNFDLMTHALSTSRKWFLVITAYFLDEVGNYYEEVLTFPPFGPVVFANEPDGILEVITQAAQKARESGEKAHYRDTCIALYLHTEALERDFNCDTATQQRAAHRAQVLTTFAPPGAS